MENRYDVVIAGGGPAGLTAAMYLARAKLRVLVLEKAFPGGQIATTDSVDNYPGLEHGSGWELAEAMVRQAKHFGAELMTAEVTGLELDRDVKTVHSSRGNYHACGILLATGAHPRTACFLGEEDFRGRGVSYCATCDGAFYAGKDLFVIGGGYTAAEESVYLTRFARHVTVLIRKEDFSCAASVADKARCHEKITVLTNTVMEAVSGDQGLTYARYRNTKTGEVTEYRSRAGETFGVFVFAGYAPATGFLKGQVELNGQGYIVTDERRKTSQEGVWAAGDACDKPLRQVVTAAADGALAAAELERYLSARKQKREQR